MLPSRRGMTFLEVVAGAALLGLLAATLFGAVGYIIRSSVRERQELAAAELSNRLMLQYLDDYRQMPSASAPVKFGAPGVEWWFRWELRVTGATLEEHIADESRRSARAERAQSANLSRFKQITMRVWLAEDSGGSPTRDPGVPQYAITRVMDPLATRNPDSVQKMWKNPELQSKMLELAFGQGGEQGTPEVPPEDPKSKDRKKKEPRR